MTPAAPLPLIDVETYVPADITVVRRSSWPGLFLQERRGSSGEVHYPGGIRQYVFYCFLKPLRSDVITDGGHGKVAYRAGEGRLTPANSPVGFRWTGQVQVLMLGFEPWFEVLVLRTDAADFARTFRHWQVRLRDHEQQAISAVGPETVRRFRRYLAASEVQFRDGTLTNLRLVLRRRAALRR